MILALLLAGQSIGCPGRTVKEDPKMDKKDMRSK